jgi:formate dehydrogenase maturation protein FdhE
VFEKDYEKLEVCPICGESRWKDADGNRRVPHKVLRHFALILRLKRMFAMKQTSEQTQYLNFTSKVKLVPELSNGPI